MPSETIRVFENRQDWEWRSKSEDMMNKFVAALQTQIRYSWTANAPTNQACCSYLNVGIIMPGVRPQVEMARKSGVFYMYPASCLENWTLLISWRNCSLTVPSNSQHSRPLSRFSFISAMSLFSRPGPCANHPRPELFLILCAELQGSEQKHVHISALVDKLSGVQSPRPPDFLH